MLRRALALLRRLGVDYACFHVYTLPLSTAAGSATPVPAGYRFAELAIADLEGSPHPELRDCSDYMGEHAQAFGLFRDDGVLACAQCVWFGPRYERVAFWPLAPHEAASMHLVTVPAERGRGLATCVKQGSARVLHERGFTRLYSRIWWTNDPSLRVSEKAGWSRVGTTLEVTLPGLRRPLTATIPRRGATREGHASSAAGPR